MFEKLKSIKNTVHTNLKRLWEPQENKFILLFSGGVFATLLLLEFPLFACATFTFSISVVALMSAKCFKSLHALACDIQSLMLDLNLIMRSFKEKLSPQTILVIEHTRRALATLKKEIPEAKAKIVSIMPQSKPGKVDLEEATQEKSPDQPASSPEKKSWIRRTFNHLRSLENMLSLLIGILAFATLLLLQYTVVFSIAAGISSGLMSFSIAKVSEFFYHFAEDTQKLVKNTQEVVVNLNEQISEEALTLMEQAGITIAALETQIPELGKGMRTMKAFNNSRMGSAVGRVLGVKSGESLQEGTATPQDKKKKKAGQHP